MNAVAIKDIILDALTTYGFRVIEIISATLLVGIAYLVFRFGYKRLKSIMYTKV
jgi:hypothetical protein